MCFLWVSSRHGSPNTGWFFGRMQYFNKPDPRDRERGCRPCVDLNLKKQLQIQQNCVRLKLVSDTSHVLERMFDLRRFTRFSPKLISSLQSRQRSLGLGTIPLDNAEPCFPHGNIVCDHMRDQCKRSNAPSVCHKLWSIV